MTPTKTQNQKYPEPGHFYKKVVLSFMGLALLLILIILYFSFISVEVILTPKITSEKIEALVDVFDKTRLEKPAPDQLIGYFFDQELRKERIDPVNTTSMSVVEKKLPAVTLYNDSGTAQSLVKTTRLLGPNNVLIRLNQNVVVPAKSSFVVNVYPDKDSLVFFEGGNVIPAGTVLTIPGLSESRQKVVYGKNDHELGYTKKEVFVVSEADLAQAKQSLVDELQRAIQQSLVSSSQYIPKDDLLLMKPDDGFFVADYQPGEVAENLTTSLKQRFTGVAVSKKMLFEQVQTLLQQKLPAEKQLVSVNEASFSAVLENYDSIGQQGSIHVILEGKASLRPDASVFETYKLIGFTKGEVVDYYSQFGSVARVSVRMFPFWITRVPQQLDHIQIIIDEEQ